MSAPPPAAVAAAGVSERLRADPGLALAVAALWLLLGLFVLYPLVMLLGRVFIDNGQFTLQGLATVLTDRHQLQAFWNSLLLGTLVGIVGTVLGFAFAFTATRCSLPRWVVGLIDVAVLLPLVSPPFTTAIGYIFSFGPRGLITYGVLGIKGNAPKDTAAIIEKPVRAGRSDQVWAHPRVRRHACRWSARCTSSTSRR